MTPRRSNMARSFSGSTPMADEGIPAQGTNIFSGEAASAGFQFRPAIVEMIQRGASDLLLKGGRPPTIRDQRPAARAADAAAQAGGTQGAGRVADDTAPDPRFHGRQGSRFRHRRSGDRPVPDQRLPAARFGGVRLPRHSLRSPDGARAAAAADPRRDRHEAARTGAGDRDHRQREVHGPRGDDRSHQSPPPRQHHHDRRSDRVPASRPARQRVAARDRHRHAVVRRRRSSTCCARIPT